MESRSFLQRHRPATLLAAVLVPLVICLLLGTAHGAWAEQAALVLVVVVVAAAATGMRSVGLTAAVASAIGYDFFLTAPYLTLAILDRSDVITTVLVLTLGAATTELALWGRRQQDRASRQQGYLTGVLETSATLASTSVTPAVLDGVATQIGEVLGGMESVRFADRAPADAPRLGVEGCAWPGGRSIDVDAEGLPTDDVVVLAAGRSGAAFLITSATAVRRPGRQQRQVALTLAAQVGAALDRDAMLR